MNSTKSSKPVVVFVGTRAKVFEDEIFMFAAGSKKAAEKELRTRFPKLWIDKPDGAYRSEKDGEWLLFIREEPVIS